MSCMAVGAAISVDVCGAIECVRQQQQECSPKVHEVCICGRHDGDNKVEQL